MAEPVGLALSLDDLIAKQQQEKQQGYGKQRRGGRGGRGSSGGEGQHERQGGRGGRAGGRGGRGRPQQQQRYEQRQPAGDHRDHQECFVDEESGDVVVRYMRTDVVRIDPAGNITLDSGGYYNAGTVASLNDALNLLGVRVTCPSGDVRTGEWSISDGRSLTRFSDGVVLAAKGPQHASRGRQLLDAWNNPHHAQRAAATAASNAAATAAGVLPFLGFIPPGVPAPRPPLVVQAAPRGGGGRGSVFSRLGGKEPGGSQRFAPY